jgi:hypothetical protein
MQRAGDDAHNISSKTRSSDAPNIMHAVQHAEGAATFTASMACNTDRLTRLHAAPDAGHIQPANALGPAAAAAAACPATVVVFLSNTMGSTSYGVAQDASVHIIRGEHRTVEVQQAARCGPRLLCWLQRCCLQVEAKHACCAPVAA